VKLVHNVTVLIFLEFPAKIFEGELLGGSTARHGLCIHRDDVAAFAGGQGLDMSAPLIERLSPFRSVLRSIVNAGNAGFVAADVVQNSLDDVRQNANVGHAGRDRTPQIVQAPFGNFLFCLFGDPLVERDAGFRPAGKSAASFAEYQITGSFWKRLGSTTLIANERE